MVRVVGLKDVDLIAAPARAKVRVAEAIVCMVCIIMCVARRYCIESKTEDGKVSK